MGIGSIKSPWREDTDSERESSDGEVVDQKSRTQLRPFEALLVIWLTVA